MTRINSAIIQIAREFWNSAGGNYKVPCDIEQAVSLSLPLVIVLLPELSIRKIESWFQRKKKKFTIDIDERALHGFLICNQGEGFVFINGTDSEEERRFTIAHEVSHFIIEYLRPRQKAVKTLGEKILEVLDGFREATIEEQIDGYLYSVSVKPFTHLLEKTDSKGFENHDNWLAENNADRLALELLAPFKQVCSETVTYCKKCSFESYRQAAYDILKTKYIFLPSIANEYAIQVAYQLTGGVSLVERLGY